MAAADSQRSHRLALIVGINEYANPDIPDLRGAVGDAEKFRTLLTAPGGYGFAPEDITFLTDETATLEGFLHALQSLANRLKSPEDVVVIYFAGHGGQTLDLNGDEPDERDETLLFHDSRHGAPDMVDDLLADQLSKLYDHTEHIMVILDSCNSGTATRGLGGDFLVRKFSPLFEPEPELAVQLSRGFGDGGDEFRNSPMPMMVTFAAAGDGTGALERNGKGVFTDALIRVFSQAGTEPLSYARASRQIRQLVKAKSSQIPYFHGTNMDRNIFGIHDRGRPFCWNISRVRGEKLILEGPPLPGMGRGAELKIFAGPEEAKAGKPCKGLVVMEPARPSADLKTSGRGRLDARTEGADPVAVGDLAVLVRPGDEFLKITVHIQPENQGAGVDANRAEHLRKAIADHPEANMLIELSEKSGDFIIDTDYQNRLVVLDQYNQVRNTMDISSTEIEATVHNLWLHARQKAFLQMTGEGGTNFKDNETLQVSLVAETYQPDCAEGLWVQGNPNDQQIIPLCHQWHVRVDWPDSTLAGKSRGRLLLGGLLLSADGSVIPFPTNGEVIRIEAGGYVEFDEDIFMGCGPVDGDDTILIFGTREDQPVDWSLLAQESRTRTADTSGQSSLFRTLDQYLQPGTRGSRPVRKREDAPWTMSSLTSRVEANSRFLVTDDQGIPTESREYTINRFDIRPYLPDDPNSSLGKVLERAMFLTNYSEERTDGVPYKQHSWNKSSDEKNLAVGIDCSRAIWYAFTRAGLPYNKKNDSYLATFQMVGQKSLMADFCEPCGDELQIGDILVYRDATRGDGHTVMVIDPVKRISWGSHGWDGYHTDTGVEFQKIKVKKDWQRWDRKTMLQVACWRHNTLSEEAQKPTMRRGHRAMENHCECNCNAEY